jgi:hypothetical protein
MNPERTITIRDKEVKMRYCAATETGFESLSKNKIEVFTPTVSEYDEDGKPVKIEPPAATSDDYIKLALAAIVAAYARTEEEPPITADDILYDATPQEVTLLLTTVIQLRAEWYQLPASIPETETIDDPKKKKKRKNA